MQQYFIEECIKNQTMIKMSKEQAHHISHVMRMKENEAIRIVDRNHNIYLSHVHYQQAEVVASIDSLLPDHTHNAVEITLLQGMIKKEKWDFLLQKCGELGVDKIVPFTSSRTVVKAKEERMDKKMQRWNKILKEACEQCKRSTLVDLLEPVDMKRALQYKSDLNIIAYEDADILAKRLSAILSNAANVTSVTIAIGPEGGFSKEEVDLFVDAGYQCVSLGARILRAETAAISAINSISFYYEMAGENK